MNIISHGLWGGVAFGRKSKKDFWLSFIIGIMPDLLSFGIFTGATVLGIVSGPSFSGGSHPTSDMIPNFVHVLYNITHSLIIFAVVFGFVWIIIKKPFLPLLAWGLHILMDIPSHSTEFFPTPFLWPVSNFYINGISWSNPYIFFPDIIILIIIYLSWFLYRKYKKD